jgi:CO/xanthine dehydrogenase Mo-binding subunit
LLAEELLDLASSNLSTQNRPLLLIDAVYLKDMLGRIQPDPDNRHRTAPLGCGCNNPQSGTADAVGGRPPQHVAEVEIDRDTGQATLARYAAVDDYGVLVNPMIAAGQAHGAIAHGIGQALLEHAAYGLQSGQLSAGSFMDYPLPRADDLVPFDLDFNSTRCTTNPLGVKGCGETGAIAAFPAIALAILDAIAPLGVRELAGPATPDRIWRALRS